MQLPDRCNEAALVHWVQDTNEPPSWAAPTCAVPASTLPTCAARSSPKHNWTGTCGNRCEARSRPDVETVPRRLGRWQEQRMRGAVSEVSTARRSLHIADDPRPRRNRDRGLDPAAATSTVVTVRPSS